MATRKSPASADKKTTTRKAPTKKAAATSAVELAANPVVEKQIPSYHEIAQLAEQFWIERGRPFGSPEVDWLRAESTFYAA
ncbi:MAG TPA: DUF2934 domain-containing protein [Acidobacteriaceae bacterium]|nr:DUF2934 domain-containing protein [Acidobacteriaceae bacterium]